MIRFLRFWIDRLINWMKIPTALLMLLAVPAVWQSFERYWVIRNQLNLHNLIYFAVGLAFMLGARVVFANRNGCAETMEHELTHTVFALVTLHPVHGVSVEDEGGGSMSFSGGGNWLIALAPYCFPLLAVGMGMFGTAFAEMTGTAPDWIYIGMGCAVGYNLFALAQQIHPEQTDFKVAGYWFTICFLPGANMLMYGALFAFVERGWAGVEFFGRLVSYYGRHLVAGVL